MKYNISLKKESGAWTVRIDGHYLYDFVPRFPLYSDTAAQRDGLSLMTRLMILLQDKDEEKK